MSSTIFSRRRLLQSTAVLGTASVLDRVAAGAAARPSTRKFTVDLCPGRVGIGTNQQQTIDLAAKHGFESVEPFGGQLAAMTADQRKTVNEQRQQAGLVWGAGGLPVEFRKDDAKCQSDLQELPKIAKALAEVGVTRLGTWIMPCHDELTYLQNFEQHASRLRQAAGILKNHGLRLGLEYVGPLTLWSSKRYPFLHTLAETKELLAAIGTSNVGVVLDSWHWYTAQESVEDLMSLDAKQIIAVDLNDAPAGIAVEEQIDNRRELPLATGVIALQAFLQALVDLDYDGPVRAEPFNQLLNAMDDDAAAAATAHAMLRAAALA